MAFYNTFATYIGNGTTTDYAIPFPRIDDEDLVVRVNDAITAYTLVSTSMLRISPAPANGAVIRIQRETDVGAIEATFQNGSPIPATKINLDFLQLLYAAQENSDLRNVWYRTSGAPASSLGKQGDWAIDDGTGLLYQKVSDVLWQSAISLVGPQGTTWRSGTGAPAGGLGAVADWYLNDANGDVYEKTGTSTWTLRDNLTGPAGTPGTAGVGLPTGGTTGQFLAKASNTNYDFVWQTLSGTGDVVGPGSATDNALVRFDGTTGKAVQNSGVTLDDNDKLSLIASVTGTAPLRIPDGVTPSSPVNGDIWATASTDLVIRRGSTNQRFALMDQINAWGQGATQQFQSSASFAAMRITPRSGNPGTQQDGDFWYNSATNQLFVRINGTNVDLGAAGAAPSWASITGKPTTLSGFGITDGLALAGGTMTGKLNTVASATGGAGLNVPPGTAPTSPVNGDLWTTTTTVNVQLNGTTRSFSLNGHTHTPAETGASAFGQSVMNAASATAGTELLTTFNTSNRGIAPVSPGGTTQYLRADGTWAVPAGAGDVVGPGSSVDRALAVFSGTTGKIIQSVANAPTLDTNGKMVTAAATATTAFLNIPNGVNPSTPAAGDLWATASGNLLFRVGSTNYQFLYLNAGVQAMASGTQIQGTPSGTFAAFRIGGAASDPGTLGNSDIWYNSTDHRLSVRVNGATDRVRMDRRPINAQSGTTYTLVLADTGRIIECTNAAAITVTVPTNASVAIPVGTEIEIVQTGAGIITVGGAGVTLRARVGLRSAGQWGVMRLYKRGADEWVVSGDTQV